VITSFVGRSVELDHFIGELAGIRPAMTSLGSEVGM